MTTTTHAPASTVFGYARVSTLTQTLEQQTEQLTADGAGTIFSDVMSGAREDRPETMSASTMPGTRAAL